MNRIHVMSFLVGSVLAFAQGCASQTSLAEKDHMTIENRSPGKVRILWSQATEKEGQLVVSGRLKRLDRVAFRIRVHVHVLELGPSNDIVQSLQSPDVYVYQRRVGRGPNWKRFEVRSANVPQPGSRLVVIGHSHNDFHTAQDLLATSS